MRAPVAKSTLSHHLEVLREAGVTQTRQEGHSAPFRQLSI
ncbi:ArsR family transcriptional regulator [Streptomyces sp. NPDC058394]